METNDFYRINKLFNVFQNPEMVLCVINREVITVKQMKTYLEFQDEIAEHYINEVLSVAIDFLKRKSNKQLQQ